MTDLKVLIQELADAEEAIDKLHKLERELIKKRDMATQRLADAHIEALAASPEAVRFRVFRHFRELERLGPATGRA